jgi:hypothetical protein
LGLILLVSAGSTSLGQQSPCTVPVNVLTPDFSSFPKADADRVFAVWKGLYGGKTVTRGMGAPSFADFGDLRVPLWTARTGLPAEAFIARDKKRAVSIESVAIDRGPRRIAFVADNGKEMDASGGRVETAVIADILSRARAEDSFALLTVGGPRVALPFGSSRDAIRAAVDALAKAPQGKPDKESALAGILEAASWLQPPQPGDSIVVLSVLPQGKHNATFKDVRRALAAGRIRLFYIPLRESFLPFHWDWPNEGGNSSPFDMESLVRASGGTEIPSRSLEHLKHNVQQIYDAIAEYYSLRVGSAGPHLNINLSPEFQTRLPMAVILYPWNLPPCPGPATPSSQAGEAAK